MNLVVISHKEIWQTSASPKEYSTVGGFPFQIRAMAELFNITKVIAMQRSTSAPGGLTQLKGNNLQPCILPEPKGVDFKRKIALLFWLPRYFSVLWHEIQAADAIHAPVPGDIGTIGILLGLAQRKPLFVRHCGTWGNRTTLADRFLDWLLPWIAGGRNVVMATGGGNAPPCPQNPKIEWIFSTTLTKAEWGALPQAKPWQPGETLRLVNVGRLSVDKNTAAIIRALPRIRKQYPKVHLDILGDGPEKLHLMELVKTLNLSEHVTLHGNLNHAGVLEALSQAHIFVFPTQTKEGFPKAVIEAMACGLPVIATDVSVIPSLLADGAGIALDKPLPEQVTEAILDLISVPQQMALMGAKARQRSREYTLENWRDLIGWRLQAAWGPLKADEVS